MFVLAEMDKVIVIHIQDAGEMFVGITDRA